MHRFSYNGRARRTVRKGGDVLRAMSRPAAHPRTAVVATHWWEQDKNFGDLLTPLLLPRFGVLPVTAPAQRADLAGVGSLLQHLAPESTATLWGTGLIEDVPRPLPHVRPLAVRGELTADRIGARGPVALGDAGLLLELLVRRRPARRWRIGVVPHFVHGRDPEYQRLARTAGPDVTTIDVRRRPVAVAAHIAACDTIVTSSLHGLITADSLGIPAVWVRGSIDLAGKEFKFHDHETVARPARPRRAVMADLESIEEAASLARAADPAAIARAKAGLVRAGHRIAQVTPHRLVAGVALPREAARSVARNRGAS